MYKLTTKILKFVINYIAKGLRWVVFKNDDKEERENLIKFIKETFKEELEDELK